MSLMVTLKQQKGEKKGVRAASDPLPVHVGSMRKEDRSYFTSANKHMNNVC